MESAPRRHHRRASVLAICAAACLLALPAPGAHAAFSLADIADEGSVAASAVPAAPQDLPEDADARALAASIAAGDVRVCEAAGVSVSFPGAAEVVELPGVFAMAACGDFFAMVTQAQHDYAGSGLAGDLQAYFDELESQGRASFEVDLPDGAVAFGYAIEEDGTVMLDVYVPTASGDLANLWIDYPTDAGDGYIEASALVLGSLELTSPALAVLGAERVGADGVTFEAPAMAWDDETGGWVAEGDALAFVSTEPDYFDGTPNLTPDDLLACAESLAGAEGIVVSSSVAVGPDGTHAYVYGAIDGDGLLEAYAFVPLADGTVTLVAALCDPEDAQACASVAAALRSLEVGSPTGAAQPEDGDSDALADLLERIGARRTTQEAPEPFGRSVLV